MTHRGVAVGSHGEQDLRPVEAHAYRLRRPAQYQRSPEVRHTFSSAMFFSGASSSADAAAAMRSRFPAASASSTCSSCSCVSGFCASRCPADLSGPAAEAPAAAPALRRRTAPGPAEGGAIVDFDGSTALYSHSPAEVRVGRASTSSMSLAACGPVLCEHTLRSCADSQPRPREQDVEAQDGGCVKQATHLPSSRDARLALVLLLVVTRREVNGTSLGRPVATRAQSQPRLSLHEAAFAVSRHGACHAHRSSSSSSSRAVRNAGLRPRRLCTNATSSADTESTSASSAGGGTGGGRCTFFPCCPRAIRWSARQQTPRWASRSVSVAL